MAVVKKFNKEFVEEIDRIHKELITLNLEIASDWRNKVIKQNYSTDGLIHAEVFNLIAKAIDVLTVAKSYIEKEEKSK